MPIDDRITRQQRGVDLQEIERGETFPQPRQQFSPEAEVLP